MPDTAEILAHLKAAEDALATSPTLARREVAKALGLLLRLTSEEPYSDPILRPGLNKPLEHTADVRSALNVPPASALANVPDVALTDPVLRGEHRV